MKNAFLIGKDLYLRAHEEKDLEQWAAWFSNPEVTRYLEHGYYPNTQALQADRLKSMYANASNVQFAIVDKTTDTLVGTVGLHQINNINRNADISIVIGNQDYWGKSFGQQAVSLLVNHAFEKLNMHKLTAGMVELNKSSENLFTQLGFEREALLKEQVYMHGAYQNLIRMALFKRVWEKRK